MARELKRVPLDFNYPIDKIWYGELIKYINTCHSRNNHDNCFECREFAKLKGIPFTSYCCPDFNTYFKEVGKELKDLCEVPSGPGYQLWSSTIDGPTSPVFETYDDLCTWCENNATIFAYEKLSKEEWKNALLINGIHYIKE